MNASVDSHTMPMKSDGLGRMLELFLVVLVILAAFAIRVYELGSLPDTVLADEADNAQDSARILHGITPENGFFGLDWTDQPAFSAYKEATFLAIFGFNIFAMRLSSAVISTLALIPFYLLLRRQFSMIASLLAAILLATNVWYLNFSRSGWNCGRTGVPASSAAARPSSGPAHPRAPGCDPHSRGRCAPPRGSAGSTSSRRAG